MNLGPHAFFIAVAYAATVTVIGGLILRAVLDYRAQVHALAELEARGMNRRSHEATAPLKTSPAPGGG